MSGGSKVGSLNSLYLHEANDMPVQHFEDGCIKVALLNKLEERPEFRVTTLLGDVTQAWTCIQPNEPFSFHIFNGLKSDEIVAQIFIGSTWVYSTLIPSGVVVNVAGDGRLQVPFRFPPISSIFPRSGEGVTCARCSSGQVSISDTVQLLFTRAALGSVDITNGKFLSRVVYVCKKPFDFTLLGLAREQGPSIFVPHLVESRELSPSQYAPTAFAELQRQQSPLVSPIDRSIGAARDYVFELRATNTHARCRQGMCLHHRPSCRLHQPDHLQVQSSLRFKPYHSVPPAVQSNSDTRSAACAPAENQFITGHAADLPSRVTAEALSGGDVYLPSMPLEELRGFGPFTSFLSALNEQDSDVVLQTSKP